MLHAVGCWSGGVLLCRKQQLIAQGFGGEGGAVAGSAAAAEGVTTSLAAKVKVNEETIPALKLQREVHL